MVVANCLTVALSAIYVRSTWSLVNLLHLLKERSFHKEDSSVGDGRRYPKGFAQRERGILRQLCKGISRRPGSGRS